MIGQEESGRKASRRASSAEMNTSYLTSCIYKSHPRCPSALEVTFTMLLKDNIHGVPESRGPKSASIASKALVGLRSYKAVRLQLCSPSRTGPEDDASALGADVLRRSCDVKLYSAVIDLVGIAYALNQGMTRKKADGVSQIFDLTLRLRTHPTSPFPMFQYPNTFLLPLPQWPDTCTSLSRKSQRPMKRP